MWLSTTPPDRSHSTSSAQLNFRAVCAFLRVFTSSLTLTIELEVVVHDEAARQSEGDIVVVPQGLQHRVIQVLQF